MARQSSPKDSANSDFFMLAGGRYPSVISAEPALS